MFNIIYHAAAAALYMLLPYAQSAWRRMQVARTTTNTNCSSSGSILDCLAGMSTAK